MVSKKSAIFVIGKENNITMKNNNSLPSFEELLSDKPINQVILMGKDKDGHKVYYANGIIPSLNAKIYIPKH